MMSFDESLDKSLLTGTVRDIRAQITIQAVDKTALEPLWDHLVATYHYLGYQNIVGRRIKYLVFYGERPIAALSFNRAFLNIGVRDAFLQWDTATKKRLIHHVVNNHRFLIVPWVQVHNLASHLLARTLRRLRVDWQSRYGFYPLMVETFVESGYHGTCYRAANWQHLGETRGYTKVKRSFVYHGHRKLVFIYMLDREFPVKLEATRRKAAYHRTLKYIDEQVPAMMLQTLAWNPNILDEIGVGHSSEQLSRKVGDIFREYLTIFEGCYKRPEHCAHGASYLKGLLSDLERKCIERIALGYGGEKVRGMQRFFKRGSWDEQKLLENYQERASLWLNDPEAMITIDGSDFVKKGNHSAGVKRQYCGRLGKVENCQSGVFLGYTSKKGYLLLDKELFIPEDWFGEEYEKRRTKTDIPESLGFRTKNEIASDMLTKIHSSGQFQAKWVGVDGFFGHCHEFLDSIPSELEYFADIYASTLVFTEQPEVFVPAYSGRGRKPTKQRTSIEPVPVSTIARDSSIPWRKIQLGIGSKGKLMADIKCLRVIESRDNLPGKEVWLYIRRYADGAIRYALCSAPADTPLSTLDRVAIMRWPIEQCFQECKSELGMAHYETRSYLGWHRHMLFVFIAHLFLQELRHVFKKKTSPIVLSVCQAKRIVLVFLEQFRSSSSIIRSLEYSIKQNYQAFPSHCRSSSAQLA